MRFDAAIHFMRYERRKTLHLAWILRKAKELKGAASMLEIASSFTSSIRLLQAAGKVDKELCLDYVHHAGAILSIEEVEAYAGDWNESEQKCEAQIIDLLRALPDSEAGTTGEKGEK